MWFYCTHKLRSPVVYQTLRTKQNLIGYSNAVHVFQHSSATQVVFIPVKKNMYAKENRYKGSNMLLCYSYQES